VPFQMEVQSFILVWRKSATPDIYGNPTCPKRFHFGVDIALTTPSEYQVTWAYLLRIRIWNILVTCDIKGMFTLGKTDRQIDDIH